MISTRMKTHFVCSRPTVLFDGPGMVNTRVLKKKVNYSHIRRQKKRGKDIDMYSRGPFIALFSGHVGERKRK